MIAPRATLRSAAFSSTVRVARGTGEHWLRSSGDQARPVLLILLITYQMHFTNPKKIKQFKCGATSMNPARGRQKPTTKGVRLGRDRLNPQ